MENLKSPDTGYQIDRILLIESSFHRINDMVFGQAVKNHFDINVEVGVNGSTITVVETVTFHQKHGDVEQFNVKVKMAGVFTVIGQTEIENFEEFGKVNGAAIIFPYIREHITNCMLKAGVGAIFMPPVNFTAGQDKQ